MTTRTCLLPSTHGKYRSATSLLRGTVGHFDVLKRHRTLLGPTTFDRRSAHRDLPRLAFRDQLSSHRDASGRVSARTYGAQETQWTENLGAGREKGSVACIQATTPPAIAADKMARGARGGAARLQRHFAAEQHVSLTSLLAGSA